MGNMIAEALSRVGRKGVVTLEEGKSAENFLYVVEGMQFDRGYISPYFITYSGKMTVEYENCKGLAGCACSLHGQYACVFLLSGAASGRFFIVLLQGGFGF